MSLQPQESVDPSVLPVGKDQSARRPRRLIALCLVGVAAGTLISLLLLPFLPRAPNARRTVCSANLRAIYQGATIYANDHGGLFPPRLEALFDNALCVPAKLVSPLSGHKQPACDYYYVTSLAKKEPADWIIAFADPMYTRGDGANVLYADGHVEYVKEPKFSQELQRFKAAYEAVRGTPPVIIAPH